MRAFSALASALWRYAKGRRGTVVLYLLMFVAANVTYLFEPYVIGLILNKIQLSAANTAATPMIVMLLALLVGLSAGFWVFHGPARVLERTAAFHIRNTFKDHLFHVVTALPVQWHKNNHSGQTINRVGKATRALFDFAENSYQLVEMLLRPTGAIVALAILMPWAAGLAIAISVGACLFVFTIDKILLPLYDKINEHEHFTASALHDYVTNITTVITLRLEKLAQSELWRRMTHYFPVAKREIVLNEWKWFVASMIIAVMTAVVLAWYTFTTLAAGTVLLAGTFFMLYDYLQKIGSAFYTFAWKYSQVVQQYADIKAVEPILSAESADYHLHCKLPEGWQTIEIKDLTFAYQDEERRDHHLKNVNVTLKKNSKIALVGESGSGKSTLMTLIRGLHPVEKATILCDGKPLAHGLRDVASSVTLIPQEPEIFENTIEYNITLDTDQSEAEVMEDVRLARFESVLAKLPNGLKTNTAEKGVNLSGGEKQRLALARGFFAAKSSDIILLDEPTSSVDSQNEMAIYKNLMEKFSDRCIISSIHKLHLLEFFDEVYVIENGVVVEQGNPKELMNGKGPLGGLWKAYRANNDTIAQN